MVTSELGHLFWIGGSTILLGIIAIIAGSLQLLVHNYGGFQEPFHTRIKKRESQLDYGNYLMSCLPTHVPNRPIGVLLQEIRSKYIYEFI